MVVSRIDNDVTLRLQPLRPVQDSSKDNSKGNRTHKVLVTGKLVNEFENNPELTVGPFATFLAV